MKGYLFYDEEGKGGRNGRGEFISTRKRQGVSADDRRLDKYVSGVVSPNQPLATPH